MQFKTSVEEICKKLRPILGKKIDKIYLQYSLSDINKKFEIEHSLNALYQKYFDSILIDRVLLEPPESGQVEGTYPLGTITYADRNLYTFGLREQDWIRHICITGMSGSGKTNFAFQLIANLIIKEKPFLIFDWKKNFRSLMLVDKDINCFTIGNNKVSNFFKFNINKPPKNIEPKEWINFLCDLISECFDTSFGVHKLLSNVMDQTFNDFGVYEGSENYPNWRQIKDRLNDMEDKIQKRGRESEWLTSAQRVAHVLTFGDFGEAINYKGTDAINITEIFNKRIIFELNSLGTIEKKFFCDFILAYIYKYCKMNEDSSEDFKYAVLVDEAHNIFLKKRISFVNESVTDTIYREIREYGIGLICLDQHISKLSNTVAGNSACHIAFQQILPDDVETVSSLMGIRDHKKFFSMLPVGHAIVLLAERYHNPFTIKVDLAGLKNKKISDNFVLEKMSKIIAKRKKNEDDIRLDKIKKKIEIKKMEQIFNMAGVKTSKEFIGKQIALKKKNEEVMNPVKRTKLVNHIQIVIAEQIDGLLSSNNNLKSIKEYLVGMGYYKSDINRAIRYCLEKKNKKEEIKKEVKEEVIPDIELSEDEIKFLKYIYKYPNGSTLNFYKKLNFSARKGNETRKKLLEKGLITIKEIRDNKGIKKEIQLSKDMINSLEYSIK